MSGERADRGDINVEIHATVRITDKGEVTVNGLRDHIMPPGLSRGWTKAEQKAGGLSGPRYEGGAAILSPHHAPNGPELAAQLEAAAKDLVVRIRNAVAEWEQSQP